MISTEADFRLSLISAVSTKDGFCIYTMSFLFSVTNNAVLLLTNALLCCDYVPDIYSQSQSLSLLVLWLFFCFSFTISTQIRGEC